MVGSMFDQGSTEKKARAACIIPYILLRGINRQNTSEKEEN
jgi:hypothetical protein